MLQQNTMGKRRMKKEWTPRTKSRRNENWKLKIESRKPKVENKIKTKIGKTTRTKTNIRQQIKINVASLLDRIRSITMISLILFRIDHCTSLTCHVVERFCIDARIKYGSLSHYWEITAAFWYLQLLMWTPQNVVEACAHRRWLLSCTLYAIRYSLNPGWRARNCILHAGWQQLWHEISALNNSKFDFVPK